MGNSVELIHTCDDTAQIDISSKNVRFLEGRFTALSIYQRGGLQVFKVREAGTGQLYSLKLMPSINNPAIRAILAEMQETCRLLKHPSVTRTFEVHAETSSPNLQIVFMEEYTPGGSLKYMRERLSRQNLLLSSFVLACIDCYSKSTSWNSCASSSICSMASLISTAKNYITATSVSRPLY
jgi:serine/threonine protein kinase